MHVKRPRLFLLCGWLSTHTQSSDFPLFGVHALSMFFISMPLGYGLAIIAYEHMGNMFGIPDDPFKKGRQFSFVKGFSRPCAFSS
jgi:hypothetical protein